MIRAKFFGGPMVVRCDACSPARVDTGVKTFTDALTIAKAAGWTAHHCGEGHGWCHFCPDCTEQAAWADPANRLVAPGTARP